jgi:Ca-activated chloride channel family protein
METVSSPELFTLKLRYKQPDGDTSKLIEVPVSDRITRGKPAESSQDLKFVAAVASFGMLLRESPYRGTATFDSAAELAREGKGEDRDGYRTEFIQLLGLAKALKP